MKKVMIHAYTQFNLGDDLFIKVLCDKYPDTTFILSAPKSYKSRFKGIRNLHIYPNDSFFVRGYNYIIKKLKLNLLLLQPRNYDLTVLIGGSLFIETDHWERDFNEKKTVQMKGKPAFLLGANFGPFHTDHFYIKHKEYFKGFTDICFRDQYSYHLFKDLPQVRVAHDIIFQLPQQKVDHVENSIVISVIKPSIRAHLAQKDAIYYQKITDIARYFIENNYTITLMAFCTYEADDEAVDTIANSLPATYLTKLKRHYYQGDLQAALDTISQAKYIIATRFHAMILGWINEKPVFPIVYSEKMKHVMDDINFTGDYTDFGTLENLKATDVFSSMETNGIDVTTPIRNSKNQFNKLDTYLLSDEKG